jgi:hypothetical protein
MMPVSKHQSNTIGVERPFRGSTIHVCGYQVVVAVNVDILGADQALRDARVRLARTTQSFDCIKRARTRKRFPDVPQQYYSFEVWFELTQELLEREIRVSEGVGSVTWPEVKVRDNGNLHIVLVHES